MELVDLRTFREALQKQMKNANWTDCALPDEFKSKFNSFGQYKIEEYYTYSAKVTSAKSMCIIPNQWFYIATCCSQYHSLLCAYKEKLQALGITDEQFESCHPSADNRNFSDADRKPESCRQRAEEYLKDYKGNDKSMLVSFLWNYEEWGGGKNIKRSNDFTESPVLNLANLINASSGLVGALAKAIANSEQARETLMSSSNWKFVYEGRVSINQTASVETPIANYITQYDDSIFDIKDLQEICDTLFNSSDYSTKNLALHIFGVLYAPHIGADSSKICPDRNNGKPTLNAEIVKGKNIGLFLRKFIQKGACPTLSPEDLELMKQYIDIFTNALKTKPFLLLAGISGTGKSQKVKELAYASCPNDKELRSDETKPGNYCLIEVKPNWHDSTELLGYWSNLSQKYMLTDFIRFVYKATKHPNVPFFLCLDEMNLAPVEQYFAEYLSVLESRKVNAGEIVSEPLLTKDKFSDCKLIDKEGNNLYENPTDRLIIEYLKANGLRLPDNLFVIGTVNMDDTTHQFSRKVIDRAFTIEMNGGKLEDMFSDENKMKLEYRPNGQEAKLELFKSKYTKAVEAIESEKAKPFADVIKAEVPKLLNAVNNILAKTPFRVSYRVQNEMVLYICNVIENATEDIDINAVIGTAFLATLLEKILPRVQGDERLLKTAEGNVFTDLKKYVEQMQNVENTEEGETNFKALVIAKLDEMNDRLTKSYFASFFG